jgi:predicted permease
MIFRELKRGVRRYAREPFLAVGAILTFAFGVGVNVSIFAAVDQILLKRLPYPDSDHLAVLLRDRADSAEPDVQVPASIVRALLEDSAVVNVTTTQISRTALRATESEEGARYAQFVPMSYSALGTLGVRPVAGRDFTEEDAKQGRRLVLVSEAYWREHLASRKALDGSTLWSPTGQTYEIAGVLPEGFVIPQALPRGPAAGIVLTAHLYDATAAGNVFVFPIVRVHPGASWETVQARVNALAAHNRSAAGAAGPVVIRLHPLRSALFGNVEPFARLVGVAASILLLVSCVNLARLMRLQALSRLPEAALSRALGASSWILARTALIEVLIVVSVGALAAVSAAAMFQGLLRRNAPIAFAAYFQDVLQPRPLLFALVVSAIAVVVATLWPAIVNARADPSSLLRVAGFGRSVTARALSSRVISFLEVKLATLLVVGAMTTGLTLYNLRTIDLGYDADGLQTVSVTFPRSTLPAGQFPTDVILAVIRGMPGVETAGAADTLPTTGDRNRPLRRGDFGGQRVPVSEGVAEALRLRFLAGRPMSAEEARTGAPVAILSAGALAWLMPGVPADMAVGRVLDLGGEPSRAIVGVVSDVKPGFLFPAVPTLFVPMKGELPNAIGIRFAVRTNGGVGLDPGRLRSLLIARSWRPALVTVERPSEELARQVADHSFRAVLFAMLGSVALLLGAVGLYATQALDIEQRRQEFAVRVALGGTLRHILLLVFRQSFLWNAASIAAGLATAYLLNDLVQTFFHDIAASDMRLLAVVALFLTAVSALAALLPIRRLGRRDLPTLMAK